MRTILFKAYENLQTLNEFLPNKSAATYDLRIKCKYNNYFCKTERFKKSFFATNYFEIEF